MITNVFVKYQRNQKSMYLKFVVLGNSSFIDIDPKNVTRTSNTETDIRLLFTKSSMLKQRVKNATNQMITVGIMIISIPFHHPRSSSITNFKPRFDEHPLKFTDFILLSGWFTVNCPTTSSPI